MAPVCFTNGLPERGFAFYAGGAAADSGGTVAFVRCYADTNDTPGCVVFVGGCHAAEAAAGAAVTGVAANARCVFSRRKRYRLVTDRTTPRSVGYQGYGRARTTVFFTVFEPHARVTLSLTGRQRL